MSESRTDANAPGKQTPAPKEFDRFLIDHALKILMDYRDSTGRGWPTITNEIVQHASRNRPDRAPSLIRSSIEHWASGKKGIGNDKFRLVYEFLTHPETLARPELAHASVLKEPFHRLLRVGRVLAEFYRHQLAGPHKADHPVPDIEALQRFSGMYEGAYNGENIVLSIDHIDGEGFSIVHYLSSKGIFDLDSGDLHFDRLSGYLTDSNLVTAHLKPVYGGGTHVIWLMRQYFGHSDEIQIINSSVVHRMIKDIWSERVGRDEEVLPILDTKDYTFILKKSNAKNLINLIENFRWRVPL